MAVEAAMTAAQRRFVYGANVALTVVLLVVLLALVNWAAARYGGRLDLTSTGLNSLSPRTVRLLGSLQQDITLTSLYSLALKEIRPHAEKHKQRVEDLLDLYETAGRGRVSVFRIDPSEQPDKVNELLERLASKPAYRDEARPHAEALQRFPELNSRIVQAVQAELPRIEEFARADARLNRLAELAIVARMLRQISSEAQATEREVQQLSAEAIPRYGRAMELVRDHLGTARSNLQTAVDWMSGDAQKLDWLAEDVRAYFAEARSRFGPVLEALDAELKQIQELKQVELEQLYESLKAGQTILVETPEKAAVLSQEDVWPFRTDRNAPPPPDDDPRDFAGEQAVSSAILRLTQKEKTAVVFTRFGGQPLLEPDFAQMNPMAPPPEAPFRTLHGLLEKENFEVTEWDVQAQANPPAIENAARTVYVVFPPREPQSPNPMQPPRTPPISDEQKQKILDAVNRSRLAIFLVGWQSPTNAMIPFSAPYAFAEYLKTDWGIDVRSSNLVVHFVPNPQRQGLWIPASRNPLMVSSSSEGGAAFRFTEHPIGRPLQSLPAGFHAAAPLLIIPAASRPAGLKIEEIAVVDRSEDVWGISNLNRTEEDFQKRQGTRRYEEDIAAPFALAVAASKENGQKLVVFASEQFAADSVLQMASLIAIGNALQLAQAYPGNPDLFVNAIHWLTGDADRIAVGPQRGTVPRLDRLKEGPVATFWRAFLVGVWPAVALAAGAAMWFVRRR